MLSPEEQDERRQIVAAQEARWLAELGWYMHGVALSDIHTNFHTHGVVESFGHPDLQIAFPLDMQQANGMMGFFITLIKEGQKFEAGVKYPDIMEHCDVEFVEAQECERTVLRLLIPDTKFRSPHDPECDHPYSRQTDDLNELYGD